jgi:uncharacterized protein (DUF1800 family)
VDISRLETSRLFDRFGFGPRPGEYAQALKDGVPTLRARLTTIPDASINISPVIEPEITDLGRYPAPNSPEVVPFAIALRSQAQAMILWWLDLMALNGHGLTERMVWFWHGHWATSIEKLNYPLPMFKQNKVFRTFALGDFNAMTKAMINDGALQFWLDGQDNTVKAPNENLGRELMELFVLGVNRYTEDDVKAISRVLTGYQVVRSNGTVIINQKRRDANPVTLLGNSGVFTGDTLSDFLVARDDCATFISERLWYRFISSTEVMPADFSAKKAFAGRNITAAVQAMAADSAMQDPKNALVKSPVEWFISACRALELTPSKLQTTAQLYGYLDKLGQVPFKPPNVGGWPAGAAWLSSATSQYRLSFANWLVKQSGLTALTQIPRELRVLRSADWLGVPEWSSRTQSALRSALDDPAQFALLALCSPEYIVSA